MDGRVSGMLTWLRAALLAAVVVAFGTVAHVSAAGRLPGTVGMALLTVGTVALCAAFLTRPASALRIVVLTVLGQAGVHVLLTLTAGHAREPGGGTESHTPLVPTTDGDRRSGSLHDLYVAGQPAPGADGHGTDAWSHFVGDLTGAHAPMALVHLAAAVLVGLWLAVGERSLWTLLALTGARLLDPVLLFAAARLRPTRPARVLPVADPVVPPGRTFLVRSVVRRGPPVLLAA